MEVSTIDFCNKKAYNLKNNREKKDILDNINKQFSIDLCSKNFVFSNKLQNLLNRNEYFIRCITQGNKYFLYLTKFQNENYTLFIDTKLSEGHKYPKILIINLNFDDSLYDNTLFSGELVKQKNNEWIYFINDLIVLRNAKCTSTFTQRLECLYEIFERQHYQDNILNNCKVEINKYFNIKDRNQIFTSYIPSLNYRINGFQFVPNLHKLPVVDLYFKKDYNNYGSNNNRDTNKISSVKKDTTDLKKNQPKIENKSKYLTFQLHKTHYQDIFNLHCYYENELKKHSIARIESLECSEVVNKLIQSKDSCEVYCKYSENFKKWVPVEESTDNICTTKDIEKYLQMAI